MYRHKAEVLSAHGGSLSRGQAPVERAGFGDLHHNLGRVEHPTRITAARGGAGIATIGGRSGVSVPEQLAIIEGVLHVLPLGALVGGDTKVKVARMLRQKCGHEDAHRRTQKGKAKKYAQSIVAVAAK